MQDILLLTYHIAEIDEKDIVQESIQWRGKTDFLISNQLRAKDQD